MPSVSARTFGARRTRQIYDVVHHGSRPASPGALRSFASSCSQQTGARGATASAPEDANGSLLEFLEARGLINQIAGDRNELDRLLRKRKLGCYSGVDPTAPSLHLGHLLPFMVLFWMYHHGHEVVSLVGGATVLVGDPTGRLTSRDKMEQSTRVKNIESITKQVQELWRNAQARGDRLAQSQKQGSRRILNNAEWLGGLSLMTFLRELGTGVRLGAMLGRDTVKNKMEKGDGMSFAELTYPLLQAWDWCEMYKESRVQIQIGGSDQYGNIVAGIDAIKHMAHNSTTSCWSAFTDDEGKMLDDKAPMGITVPLLTTSGGEKFGKSAGNAVWLDRSLTTSFDLYGFLLRTSDADVKRYLNLFTLLPNAEISAVMEKHAADPGKRLAQHLLATEVLRFVHGDEEAQRTKEQHQASRAPTLATLGSSRASQGAEGSVNNGATGSVADQRTYLPEALVRGRNLAQVIYNAGIAASKSAANRLVDSGGLYVATIQASSTALPTSEAVEDSELKFVPVFAERAADSQDLLLAGNVLILRQGKWKTRVIEMISDDAYEQMLQSASLKSAPDWDKLRRSEDAQDDKAGERSSR